MTKICIVIPIHNEQRTIGSLVGAIVAKGLDAVVIDDGSSDGSGSLAREKGAVVITNAEKQGKGLSLKKGFAHALAQGYDGVITMDGDGQHDAADIDRFLERINTQPDCIITGSRMENSQGMPWLRLVTNSFMSALISCICRRHLPDTQCGFRYISADILRQIELQSNDFEIETEVLIKASRKGYPIFALPIKTIYRNEKSKINPFKDTLRFIVYITKETFRPDSTRR